MNKLLLVLFFSIPFLASGQKTYSDPELDRIIKDAPNRFSTIKGRFKEVAGGDSVFYSKVIIPKSLHSEIIFYPETKNYSFMATLDSSDIKSTRKITEKWKKYLDKVLGKAFTMKKQDADWGSLGKMTAYNFSNGTVSVYVSYTYEGNKAIASKCYLGVSLEE